MAVQSPPQFKVLNIPNGTPAGENLGFLAHSVIIDNRTSSFLYIPAAGRYVDPGLGASMRIRGTQTAEVLWQAPPGSTQFPAVAGEVAQVTFFAEPFPPGFGITSLQKTNINQLGVADLGSGADGVINIAGTTTLTQNMNYSNLTIAPGGILNTAGFIVRCTGPISNSGTIRVIGTNGTNANPGVGGVGGARGTLGGGGNGGAGGPIGANGLVGTAPTAASVEGGAGGTGGNAAFNGGVGGAVIINPPGALTLQGYYTLSYSGGGGGGGGSGAAATFGGGGGGGGGGVVLLICASLTGNGIISVLGGTGGAAPGLNAAGGAGGGGGIILVLTKNSTYTGTLNAGGGAGGAGNGTGASGAGGGGGSAAVILA